MNNHMVLEKKVGETPLACMEAWRAAHPQYEGVPLAYAGRLDPMASGKLLVLIGKECKKQQAYHGLDKEYRVEVLFGVCSDSGDVLGLINEAGAPQAGKADLRRALASLHGKITLPYPVFSSRTVRGKPLFQWALEGRLHEIEIPTYTAISYKLKLGSLTSKTRTLIFDEAMGKVASIPPVSDRRKELGNDFRRPEVRQVWQRFKENGLPDDRFSVATITATVSSGSYMRTLAEEIAQHLGTCGLSYSIHRTKIGRYQPLPLGLGFWWRRF